MIYQLDKGSPRRLQHLSPAFSGQFELNDKWSRHLLRCLRTPVRSSAKLIGRLWRVCYNSTRSPLQKFLGASIKRDNMNNQLSPATLAIRTHIRAGLTKAECEQRYERSLGVCSWRSDRRSRLECEAHEADSYWSCIQLVAEQPH
jgi:hypothetical protein